MKTLQTLFSLAIFVTSTNASAWWGPFDDDDNYYNGYHTNTPWNNNQWRNNRWDNNNWNNNWRNNNWNRWDNNAFSDMMSDVMGDMSGDMDVEIKFKIRGKGKGKGDGRGYGSSDSYWRHNYDSYHRNYNNNYYRNYPGGYYHGYGYSRDNYQPRYYNYPSTYGKYPYHNSGAANVQTDAPQNEQSKQNQHQSAQPAD